LVSGFWFLVSGPGNSCGADVRGGAHKPQRLTPSPLAIVRHDLWGSPRRGFVYSGVVDSRLPTAGAVGCILAPRRGWVPGGIVEHDDAKACHRGRTNLGDSSTRFLGHKKRPDRNPNSFLETHGHKRRTIVTQPEIFKTPRGVLAVRIRNINPRIVTIAAGFEAKQFALMQVKKRSRAARIGALRKHFAVP
jgi:hypothetical protein